MFVCVYSMYIYMGVSENGVYPPKTNIYWCKQ